MDDIRLLVMGAGASALLIFAGIGRGLLHMQDAIGRAVFGLVASDIYFEPSATQNLKSSGFPFGLCDFTRKSNSTD